MAKVFINPGSGPIDCATEEHARENIKHFIVDCGVKGIQAVRAKELDDNDGRYAFILFKGTRCHEVQMPGLTLDRVRYTGEGGQNIWNYPRLYVDGSSWVWKYALLPEDHWVEPEPI